jgi:hypothetical protein
MRGIRSAVPPGGYTLLSSPPPPLVINQNLYPRLGFDPAAFVPVSFRDQAHHRKRHDDPHGALGVGFGGNRRNGLEHHGRQKDTSDGA